MNVFLKFMLSGVLWISLFSSTAKAQLVHSTRVFETLKTKIDECKEHFDLTFLYLLATSRSNEIAATMGGHSQDETNYFVAIYRDFLNSGKISLTPEQRANAQVVSCVNFAEGLMVGVLSKTVLDDPVIGKYSIADILNGPVENIRHRRRVEPDRTAD